MTEAKTYKHFSVLNAENLNKRTEKKKTGKAELTYLSWAWAWGEVKKIYPDAVYKIFKQENGLPFVYDPLTGYMVFTEVTIEGITHEMWLPVMDGSNKAMKGERYEYKTKYETKAVEQASMFDINKTIMRCLTKNLAMFGLGLYIFAGEDLPEGEEPEAKPETKWKKQTTPAPSKFDIEIEADLKKCKTVAEVKTYYANNKGKTGNPEGLKELANKMILQYKKESE